MSGVRISQRPLLRNPRLSSGVFVFIDVYHFCHILSKYVIYNHKEDKEKGKAKYHMIADASTPDILSVKFPQLGEGGPSLTLRRIEQ